MNKTSLLIVASVLFFCTTTMKSQTSCVTDAILSTYSARNFTTKPVTDSQIETILKCGIKAPSARNSQMWKFTVVKSSTLLSELMPNITTGNILIIVSGQDANQPGMNVAFDCALATENMYLAAQNLGLGAHIYMAPVSGINSRKQDLGIPDGYSVITVLRIGNVDQGVDAVSSASPRNSLEEVVNYR
ncbi:MAG: nitroreductase family protein [Bacteroidales bacterium]|nr:nitroreductase family protein [Bacteroidales bacterium]